MSELNDHLAIRELTARYNRAIDEGDFQGWIDTFSEDGVYENRGKKIRGHAELLEFVRARTNVTIHATTDPIITINGDTAEQRCTLIAFVRTDEAAQLRGVGYYIDQLVRTADGWRFSHRASTTWQIA